MLIPVQRSARLAVSVRLTPYQARILEAVRKHELPAGAELPPASHVLVLALLELAKVRGVKPAPEVPDLRQLELEELRR